MIMRRWSEAVSLEQPLSPALRILKSEYQRKAPEGSPEFDPSLAETFEASYGFFDGLYDNGCGVRLYVIRHMTSRSDEFGVFTDIKGFINGEYFEREI